MHDSGQRALPSLLPRDSVRSGEARVVSRVAATAVPSVDGAASVVAALVYLVGRYSRDDLVTIDLTPRAQALLAATAPTAAGRCRLTVEVPDDVTLQTLAERLHAAAVAAVAVTDDPSARGVLVDVGDGTNICRSTADVVVSLTPISRGLEMAFTYDATQFAASSIIRLRDAIAAMLSAAHRDPAITVGHVALVTDEERRTMDAWNATATTGDGADRVCDLITAQAARSPDAVAAECAGASLTYRQLVERAHVVAGELQSRGLRHGDVVGLCVERSFETLIAMVAVHLAGGAFLPIDPDLPIDRVRFKLQDVGCTTVLTQAHLVPHVQSYRDGLTVIDIASVLATSDTRHLVLSHTRDVADRLAYVMYTSGSTGTPKGVAIPHRALCNHAQWFAQFTGLSASDRVLQIASISFDASMAEIFAPLCVGATVVLAPRDAHRDLLGIAALAARERITFMQQVPSALRVMVSTADFASLTTLRYLVSGGEMLDGALAQQILRVLPHVRLGNCYGPTEATVDALAWEVVRGTPAVDVVPIGRPVANMRVRILDAHGAAVPIGMPGELHLGGRGLAVGYVNRPERTATRFIADPWLPGERLYRTGDVARYRADGMVECLGRVDTQIKLRGYRIEPAEIEAVLLQQPEVREASVILREDVPGDPQLVAYVVPRDGAPIVSAELRTRLRAIFPSWMVPSAFCILEAMPVMPSGKLDRRALPAPEDSPDRDAAVAPLTDPLEQSLRDIWESVLGVRPIAPEDNFFALGGHSLKAIRLLAEIERVHGVTLRAATLFEAPTIRDVAKRLTARKPESVSTVVRVQPAGTRTPLFLAPGGGGELFIFEALARALGDDQPLYVLDLYVFDEITLPVEHVTLADVAARMLEDIRAIQPHGPYQLAGYSLGGNVSIEIAQQLRAAGEDVHLLALLDCDGPDYPVLQPVPQRILSHARHALSLGPGAAVSYLVERAQRMLRKTQPAEPALYRDQPELALVPAQTLAALENALRPVLLAWEQYRPMPYDGRTVIVRADIRRPMVGVDDDDPWLGWKPVLRGEVVLDRLPCDHFSMFHASAAPHVVAMLGRYLFDGPVSRSLPPASAVATAH